MAVTVKVGQVPGIIREFAVNEGSTVESIFALADLQINPQYKITLNGDVVDAKTVVEEDATILLTREIRGA